MFLANVFFINFINRVFRAHFKTEIKKSRIKPMHFIFRGRLFVLKNITQQVLLIAH